MLQTLLAFVHPLFAPAFSAWGAPMTWLEILAFALSLWMVGCEMRVHVLAWPLAMASSLLYALLFADSRLYGEATLQLFFVAMSVWGWWRWRRGGDDSGAALPAAPAAPAAPAVPTVHRLPPRALAAVLVFTLLAWPLMGALLQHGTDSDRPYLDALPTVGSIAGTWLLGRKFLENWPAWVLVNAASVALFASKQLWLTVLLYALFTVLSLAGWRAWARLARAPAAAP